MCSVEKRNEILKKPVLTAKDVEVLFDCKKDMSYKYVELINRWLEQNGRVPLVPNGAKNRTKAIRTVDYIDFAGLPRELMV